MINSRINKLKHISLFTDEQFPDLTIRQFSAGQLNISEIEVCDALYDALTPERQTTANKELIRKALAYKVNASGAIILMINTNEGLQLLYGYSQRRKKVVSSNGVCEENESMAATALREFSEELGNPPAHGIMHSIVSNPQHCRSLQLTNKIGKTAHEIANRIVDVQGSKSRLFINMSSLYVNESPVSMRDLQNEIAAINVRLNQSAPYYQQAVTLIYGDKTAGIDAANLADSFVKAAACKIINDFRSHCFDIITQSFSHLFEANYDDHADDSLVKKSLLAIIDLTENNSVGLVSKEQLEILLSMDHSNKDNLEKLKSEYFAPSFENIIAHQSGQSPAEFLETLESYSTKGQLSSLGLLSVPLNASDSAIVHRTDDYAINTIPKL